MNYNVRAYLEQCLRTVLTALHGIDGEVFVVDNQSTDGSVEMVRVKFPSVKVIANKENVGFSRANNQAIRIAGGDYALLLNPDTVVGEDVFRKVIAFMDSRPKIGGLGVKMIDGTGRFLPESKRGLPTPKVAFFKIIGLTRLFPKSKVFGRYHLGHLPENEAAPIEILSGACMFLRKKMLDEVGLLDESFFMYGEDIDLSYRITLAGYENWYFPDARIIHYKGESTKKSSVNYVFVFYNAMAIFARKHFAQRKAGIFPWLINGSIYLSAAAAIAVRFLDRAMLPLLDLLTVLLVLAFSPIVPERWPVLQELGADLIIGGVVVAWMAFFGGYDRPIRVGRSAKAIFFLWSITFITLWISGSSNSDLLEMSRPFLFTGIGSVLLRACLHALRISGMGQRHKDRERVLAIGEPSTAKKALALLWQTHYGLGSTMVIEPGISPIAPSTLMERIRQHGIGEVIFCAKDLTWSSIISTMEKLKDTRAIFKIAQPGNEFVIGPSSIESINDLFILDDHALSGPMARRNKRIVDVAFTILVLIGFPIAAFFVRSPVGLLRNAFSVLRGDSSWIGYNSSTRIPGLPKLPKGIIGPISSPGDGGELAVRRANILYAKDHSVSQDLGLLFRRFRLLGGS